MDTGVVVALILGGASIISSICFGIVPSYRRTKIEKLEAKNQRLLKDIKLFHEIEEELLLRLENKGCNKKSTKEDVRKIIAERNLGMVLSEEAQPSRYKKQIK